MATETQIVNMGILLVGGDQIDDIDDENDNSTEAMLARLFFDTARDAVLESRAWPFATVRDLLDTPSGTAECEYANTFAKPSNCLRILRVSVDGTFKDQVNWLLEGENILSDADEIYIKYVSQITDPTKFPNTFIHALAGYIAFLFSIPVTRNDKVQAIMQKQYLILLEQATSAMHVQGTGPDSDTTNNVRTISVR